MSNIYVPFGTPANWVPCEPIIVSPPKTFAELEARNVEINKNRNGMSWYLSFKEPKKCITTGQRDEECDTIKKING